MFAFRLAFKNVISRRSSFVIVLFVAFSIALLVMSNAVFDGTRTGIEKTFSGNFTGDIVIRPKADFPMSLFGDETPITGSLSELPTLVPYSELFDFVSNYPGIDHVVPQITGRAVIRIDGDNVPVCLFGVDGHKYSDLMEGISIVEGTPYEDDEHKIMLSTQSQKIIYDATDVMLKPGDTVQLVSTNGSSYTLRAVTVSGIYEYSVKNDLQDKIVLIDPDTLRSLIGLESSSIDESFFDESNSGFLKKLDSSDSVDDLFGEDMFAEEEELFSGASEEAECDAVPDSVPVEAEEASGRVVFNDDEKETVWNYLVCDVDKGIPSSIVIRHLNRYFSKKDWPVQAVDWRTSAGMASQYIYWMRLIFNIGIIVILGTGFIVVSNSLVISALDRTKETGVLRAMGGSRKFIGIQYLLETLLITVTAGVLGCVLGVIGNSLLVGAEITFSNSYLIQLFGGTQLKTIVTSANIAAAMTLSLILAVIGWIYPVRIALETSPVMAMEAVH